MPRPKIDPEKRRTERFETLLTPAEAKALEAARKGPGHFSDGRSRTPVSEFIRDALLPLIRPWLDR